MKKIMARAWEMYKAAGCTTRGEFAVALKAAWAETKKVDAITAFNGKAWINPRSGETRHYLNVEKVFAKINNNKSYMTNQEAATKIFVINNTVTIQTTKYVMNSTDFERVFSGYNVKYA